MKFPQHINRLTIFLMKFMFFSAVSPLEKVKIKKSCGILILEKTENILESVKAGWRASLSQRNCRNLPTSAEITVFNLENIIFQVVVVRRFHSITPSLPVRHLESRFLRLFHCGLNKLKISSLLQHMIWKTERKRLSAP